MCVCVCDMLTPAHLYREEAGEVVLPVVAGCDDDPLLHAVVLDAADAGADVETPCDMTMQHHSYDTIH